ncbi:sugar ABC transporter ATP-binding protein [Palleronia aestuarii]|nr:sugar ABC transporter ATP-binding protein [Palleronia aestuarii]
MSDDSNILDLNGITKTFGPVTALSRVDLTVRRGEVHAILGENGAGKSTTLKIINGELDPDDGTVAVAGRATTAPERARGDIAMVHQELAVFTNMSVAENIFAGDLPRRGGRVDFDRMHARAAELLSLFGLEIETREIVSRLTPGQQQIVEILRAVRREASLLILDEPTSGLNNHEATILLSLVKRLSDENVTVLYVSHRLHEVLEIADRITVLRDGASVTTLDNDALVEDDLIRHMVGRDLAGARDARARGIGETALSVKSLTQIGEFEDVTLECRRGEIVGVFGLEGSGAADFSEALYGLKAAGSGRIEIAGRDMRGAPPAAMRAAGLSYLPANRKEAGLYMERSIVDNIAAPILDRISRMGLVDRDRIRKQAETDVGRFAIRVPGIHAEPRQLSGGNQQKVLFSACLADRPDILALNEPTRGVDVGAKAEVHDVIRSEADAGRAVVVFSSDLPELLRLADRIVVMRSRRIAGEVSGQDLQEDQIMALAAGTA